MNKITGTYFDGRHPLGSEAALIWSGREASIVGEHALAKHALSGIRVSPRSGSADRFISLPDGTQLQCADTPMLDPLPQEGTTEGIVAWFEQRWGAALLGIAVIVAAVAYGYFYGLPRLAEYAAARIPISAEREVGDTSLRWLDSHGFLMPSNVGRESQQELNSDFQELVKGLPHNHNYRLLFRDAPGLGANAFALPGGTIVITDGLTKLTTSPDEALAVLAHEIGHVERRHVLRHVLQDSAVGAIITTVTGDATSLSSLVTGLPIALAQANYSRNFETEADAYAFDLLKRHGVSPSHFANIMEKLEKSQNPKGGNVSFIDSHPPTPERVLQARAASVGFDSSAQHPASPAPWPVWANEPNCADGVTTEGQRGPETGK
jgi:Zn-dependent protease with chaperone function